MIFPELKKMWSNRNAVADLAEGDGGPGSPLFWVKKNRRRKKSRRGKQKKKPPSPHSLAQGLDTASRPLAIDVWVNISTV